MTISSNDMEHFFNTLPTVSLGVSCKNFPQIYATETTLQNIYTELNDNNLGVTFNNTSIQVLNNPPRTAIPTYFEFNNLNVNDSAVSRLVQNTTGNDVYITQVNIFTTDNTHSVDWNEWFDGGSCEHILEVCSSNSNYPADAVRRFFEASTFQQLYTRYNIIARLQHGHLSNTNFRSAVAKVGYNPPVLCEAGNYIRLYRNGSSTALTGLFIAAIGYY